MPATAGELLFRDYLEAMGYPYEFEKGFPCKSKRPDFTVSKNGDFLLDVKDFETYLPSGFGAYDPYTRIREKIDQGREKFKEFKEYPCSLVLFNNGNALVHLETPDIVLGAMYGDAGFTFPVNTTSGAAAGPLKPAFLRRGKMIHATELHNTTISALITLRHVAVGRLRFGKLVKEFPNLDLDQTMAVAAERFPNFNIGEIQLGVIVWENAVARIPLSRDLFTGPYDERWGHEDGQQSIVFRGEKLSEFGGDGGE